MNMMLKSAILFVCIYITCVAGQIGGLSSKLDFGETQESNPAPKKIVETIISVRQGAPQTEKSSQFTDKTFDIRKISLAADEAAEKIKEDFKELSLICVDGGCNTTGIKTTKLKSDELNTDVIVRVLTDVKVNTSEGIKGKEKDVDVPVFVGTGGNNDGRRVDVAKPSSFIPYNVNQNHNTRPKSHSQLPIPHFNPSFNNHYFGEIPPPVYVWHKRRNSAHNPNAFIPSIQPYWKTISTNDWQRSLPSNNNRMPKPVLCTCADSQSNWYPSIDDKMNRN